MTIDITETLLQAATSRWSRDRARDVLALASHLLSGSTTDWDEAAGEDWARVIRDDTVASFVWMRGPLVILTEGDSALESGFAARQVLLLRVPDMDADCLRAERTSVEQFAGRSVSPVLDVDQFSAEDLVWAT